MKQQQKHFIKLIFLFAIGINYNSYSQQPIAECQEDFHGVGEVDKECDETIIVTSTSSEGPEGTIFYGLIYSRYNSVKYIPGYSKVRLVPYDNTEGSRAGGRTKSGTGGKPVGGGRYSNPNLVNTKVLLSDLKIYPNPVSSKLSITYTASNLNSYEVYSIEGRLLVTKDLDGSNNYSINLSQLSSGLHLLKLYSKNGEVINKHIIKQ
ncbi:T9SS type A sorting domain-containing protein [Psychroserpens ponticola]|uniref:T9SS type A sorting domain-containing protein n=1 Tax=Psychroserpens ponticola TaxID=2932268 RepID=A0ABY7RZR3_9FLAO|nr:T9SS type A sorting domain-containing protein [Psychroserpens ponticola]WCO02635.1 T9SS type A sorting domain-containing protein [Psychroserpens ponticola]